MVARAPSDVLLTGSPGCASSTSFIGDTSYDLVTTFTASGTLTIADAGDPVTADYLIVAGGGSGGTGMQGGTPRGGGAGGYKTFSCSTNSSLSLAPGSYSVTIGGGGATGGAQPNPCNNGSPSDFAGLATTVEVVVKECLLVQVALMVDLEVLVVVEQVDLVLMLQDVEMFKLYSCGRKQWRNRRKCTQWIRAGGGGGGANAAGSNTPGSDGGAGGGGKTNCITGSPVAYAGGGGGGAESGTGGSGGSGGGGAGNPSSNTSNPGGAGPVNTGGGGGGGSASSPGNPGPAQVGGAGGSGVVVIEFLVLQELV